MIEKSKDLILSKPLEVVWFCVPHHTELHNSINSTRSKDKIQVGKYSIKPARDYKSVWIECDDGEGGQFPMTLLEKAVEEFYNKYF